MFDPNPLMDLPLDRSETLTSLLRQRSLSDPDTSVIGFYDRTDKTVKEESQFSFLRRASQFGLELQQAGVGVGDNVIIVCSTPRATLLAFLGSVIVGAVPAVIAVRAAFDDTDNIARRVSEARLLLGDDALVVGEAKGSTRSIATLGGARNLLLDAETVRELPDDIALIPVEAGRTCHVQLTSGSTDAGKAVAVPHSSLLANVRALRDRAAISPYDVFVTWLPLYHDMGLAGQALTALACGIDIHFMSPFDFLADPGRWLQIISDKRGTIAASPSFGFDLVTRRMPDPQVAGLDLSSWKSAYCGAEPISASTARAFFERFAPCGLRPEAFTPSYGLAEATLAVTGTRIADVWRAVRVTRSSLAKLEEIELTDGLDALEVVALGRPVEGLSVALYDESGDQVLQDLKCGEIVVNGSSVTDGWIAEGGKLVPFAPEGLRTGDIGFFQGGELFVVERIKNIVIRNGHNYSAQVLEQTLASLTGVDCDDVVVLDRDITVGAELTAIVEVDKRGDLNRYLQPILNGADLFEPPLESIVLVKRGTLPRTTSGKKRHAATRQLLNIGELPIVAQHEVVPALAGETTDPIGFELAQIIAEESEDVSAEQDESQVLKLVAGYVRARGLDIPVLLASRLKYDLDFDSLGLLELAMAAETEFGIELSRETVVELKTVQDLFNAVRSEQRSGGPSTGGLAAALDELRSQIPQIAAEVDGVRANREVLIEGRWQTDFSSCSYLGLDEREEMFEAVNRMHAQWGLQRGPSRAVVTVRPCLDLETRLASLIGVPDTMIFPTISLLHFGVIPVLAGADGAIIIDTAAHTSMQEASLLASAKGASLTPFEHGNLEDLEGKLGQRSDASTRIIVVDGVYSMSGTTLDLPAYQRLAEKYDAVIYIDDAHGFGVYGENPTAEAPYGFRGNGTVKHSGCTYDRVLYIGGLAKAYSSTVAFISCPTPHYRRLFSTASTMIFAHSAPIAPLAQANAGLDINDREGVEIRDRIYKMSKRLIDGAKALDFEVGSTAIPIVNVIVGDLQSVVVATRILWEKGIHLMPAVFPAAPLDRGGMRFTVTASNTDEQIEKAIACLALIRDKLSVPSGKPANEQIIDLTESAVPEVL